MGPPDANGNPSSTSIIDTPASYHNGGCTFAFADGHVEIHRWLGSTIKITAAQYNYPAKDSLVDLQWLQSRTTAAK
jgi:prepilin-type processing-associated H-X9-DG protein